MEWSGPNTLTIMWVYEFAQVGLLFLQYWDWQLLTLVGGILVCARILSIDTSQLAASQQLILWLVLLRVQLILKTVSVVPLVWCESTAKHSKYENFSSQFYLPLQQVRWWPGDQSIISFELFKEQFGNWIFKHFWISSFDHRTFRHYLNYLKNSFEHWIFLF